MWKAFGVWLGVFCVANVVAVYDPHLVYLTVDSKGESLAVNIVAKPASGNFYLF